MSQTRNSAAAKRLCADAKKSKDHGNYRETIDLCTKAIDADPYYAEAYRRRGDSYTYQVGEKSQNSQTKFALQAQAIRDYKLAILLVERNLATEADSNNESLLLSYSNLAANYTEFASGSDELESYTCSIETSEKAIAITKDNLDYYHCAKTYILRAQSFCEANKENEAYTDFGKAIVYLYKLSKSNYRDSADELNKLINSFLTKQRVLEILKTIQDKITLKEILQKSKTKDNVFGIKMWSLDGGPISIFGSKTQNEIDQLLKKLSTSSELTSQEEKHQEEKGIDENISTAHALRKQNPDEAIKYCHAAIKSDPTNVFAYYERAKCYDAQKKYRMAMIDYQLCLQLQPFCQDKKRIAAMDLQQTCLFNIGAIYRMLKNFSEAINIFTQIIKLFPNYPDMYNVRGETYEMRWEQRKANPMDLEGAKKDLAYAIMDYCPVGELEDKNLVPKQLKNLLNRVDETEIMSAMKTITSEAVQCLYVNILKKVYGLINENRNFFKAKNGAWVCKTIATPNGPKENKDLDGTKEDLVEDIAKERYVPPRKRT